MQKLSLIVVFTSFLPASFAHAEDRRPDKTSLTLANYNAEFLWDGIQPEDGSDSVTFPWRGNPEAARAHMEKAAAIIRKTNADIVNVDEVENLDALKLMNETFLSDLGYRAYLVNGRDTYTGQDVGLLTRIDPDEKLWREDRKGTSGRVQKSASKNYTAKITVGDERIALIGVHFLSRPTDPRRLDNRQAQADSILTRARELDDEGYRVVILGDINDYDGSKEASDHASHQPITNVLSPPAGHGPRHARRRPDQHRSVRSQAAAFHLSLGQKQQRPHRRPGRTELHRPHPSGPRTRRPRRERQDHQQLQPRRHLRPLPAGRHHPHAQPPIRQRSANPVTRILRHAISTLLLTFFAIGRGAPADGEGVGPAFRVATFNVALSPARNAAHLDAVAAVIRAADPDVLLLNEVDDGTAAAPLAALLTRLTEADGTPLYPHVFTAPVNTGDPSGLDLDADGETTGPADAWGYGAYPGQYGMAVLSKFPLEPDRVRTFRTLKWRDRPGHRMPAGFFPPAAEAEFPLSSKSHWDVPIRIEGHVLHLLASHPTPPVFDGPEDRNGRRNADEIGFWTDYLTPDRHGWIVDDAGHPGGLAADALFVVAGDLNNDADEGDGDRGAITALLTHPRVTDPNPTSAGGPATGHDADDTAAWGKRVDYAAAVARPESH